MPRERSSLPAVDHIKSAAILAVLVQHGVPAFLDRPLTPRETTLFGIVCFHVPAFLFVSGFLSHADRIVTWREVAGRLWRIVPPYLVATAVVCVLGFVTPLTPRRLFFVTVTGAAFGHYYFVPMLVFCVLLLPAISRMSTPILIGVTSLMLVAAQYLWVDPRWRLAYEIFWHIRHPILQFHLGFFLCGVIAARVRPTLTRVGNDYRFLTIGITAFAVAVLASFGPQQELIFHPAMRTAYTLAVIALIASAAPSQQPPAWIRFLSDATFTIYLYHWFAYLAVTSLLPEAFPLPLRIPLLMSAGVALSATIVFAGRRLLGSRSRPLLGT